MRETRLVTIEVITLDHGSHYIRGSSEACDDTLTRVKHMVTCGTG